MTMSDEFMTRMPVIKQLTLGVMLGMVRQFHTQYGVPSADKPTLLSAERAELRYDLAFEELAETFVDGARQGDMVVFADGLVDQLYILLGTFVEAGIDPQPLFEAVHAANMAKLGPDGKPILRADGKVLKPPGWKPADLVPLLKAQGWKP